MSIRERNYKSPSFVNPLEWFVFCLVANEYPHAIIETSRYTCPSSLGSTTPDQLIKIPNAIPIFLEVTRSAYVSSSSDPKYRQRRRGLAFTREEGKDQFAYLVFYLNTMLTSQNIVNALNILDKVAVQRLDSAAAQDRLDLMAKKTPIPDDVYGWQYDWHQRLMTLLSNEPVDSNTGYIGP